MMEKARNRERWLDWVNLVLGLWLFAMPLFGYMPMDSAGAVSSFLFGSVIAVVSVAALVREQLWEEWLNFGIGLWLLASPFILDFTDNGFALWSTVIAGLFIVGDALWGALTVPYDTEDKGGHHPSHA